MGFIDGRLFLSPSQPLSNGRTYSSFLSCIYSQKHSQTLQRVFSLFPSPLQPLLQFPFNIPPLPQNPSQTLFQIHLNSKSAQASEVLTRLIVDLLLQARPGEGSAMLGKLLPDHRKSPLTPPLPTPSTSPTLSPTHTTLSSPLLYTEFRQCGSSAASYFVDHPNHFYNFTILTNPKFQITVLQCYTPVLQRSH